MTKMKQINDNVHSTKIFTVQQSPIVLKKYQKGWKYQVAGEIISKDGVEWQCKFGIYGTLTLLILIGAPFSFILIPLHNVFTNQKYWYELAINTLSLHIFCAIAFTITFQALT